MLTLGGVFLAIHIGRMPTSDAVLGRISPFVATLGDIVMTLAFATAVVVPWRLLATRHPAARATGVGAAPRREIRRRADEPGSRLADRHLARESFRWFTVRLRQARSSFLSALLLHRTAGDRFLRGVQSDLGLQLVLQHGKLGEQHLPKDDGASFDPWRVSMINASDPGLQWR